MQVGHGLSRGGSIVDANVEAIRLVARLQPSMRNVQQREQGLALRFADLEQRADVALWNDEAMPNRDWKSIEDEHGVVVLFDDALSRKLTECAVGQCHTVVLERDPESLQLSRSLRGLPSIQGSKEPLWGAAQRSNLEKDAEQRSDTPRPSGEHATGGEPQLPGEELLHAYLRTSVPG